MGNLRLQGHARLQYLPAVHHCWVCAAVVNRCVWLILAALLLVVDEKPQEVGVECVGVKERQEGRGSDPYPDRHVNG